MRRFPPAPCYHFATQLGGTRWNGLVRRRGCASILGPKTLTKWHVIELAGMAEGEQHDRSVPAERLPRQMRQRLHIVNRIHLGVLVALVEFDAAGHTGKVLRRGHDIADRLRVLAAAANDVSDHEDLIEGVS